MKLTELGVEAGDWIAITCATIPGSDCKVLIAGPEKQRVDLLEAAVAHAVKTHGYQDTPEVRTHLSGGFEPVSS